MLGRYKIIKASLIIYIFAGIVVLIPVAVYIVLFTNPEWGCDPTLFASGQQNVGCDVGFIGLIVVPVLFYIAINPFVPKLFGRARKNLIFYRGIVHYRFIFLTPCWLGKPHSNHISLNRPRVWDSPHFLIEKIE